MGSQQKDIELNIVNHETNGPKTTNEKLNVPANDEEDVIIGRFRKISSAKSMAATNGNIQYPSEVVKNEPDLESGLQFKTKETEKEKLLELPNVALKVNKSPVTKSSFRDTEKPSRFKDQPSSTRFQVRFFIYYYYYLY